MPVSVEGVGKASVAERLGIQPGDILLSVNGRGIRDVLDYGFHTASENIELKLIREGGGVLEYAFKKREDEDIGLLFGRFLMDEERRCSNACMFCFIDQLPAGMRDSLYFKDDDERLSYLFGNYLSLTNISNGDVERLIEMRIMPVNISVHTTNPALRCHMMGNDRAGEALSHMYRLAEKGIELNCQIVLCPGVNDGMELERTLSDLEKLYPSLLSVSVVPVGLTAHRENLKKVDGYDKASAARVLSRVEARGKKCLRKYGVRLFYPADEWFLLAERSIPAPEYYDGFEQLENGVGMLAQFASEFREALGSCDDFVASRADIITGEAAAGWLRALLAEAKAVFPGVRAAVHAVKNDFFGGNVSVAGLLTGADIMRQVPPLSLSGDSVVIPRSALRSEGDIFLDDVSLEEFSVYYNKEIKAVSGGRELFGALTRGE